jgi:O-antigen/teichoic acid export membrane protein
VLLTTPTKLAAGSALRATNLFANAAVGLILTPMIVHALGDRMYGIWALVASFIGYYGLLDLGLTSAATRYVARAIGASDLTECNRVFNTAMVVYFGMAVIAVIMSGILAAASYIWAKHPGDAALFGELILILGTYTAAGIPMRAFIGTLNAACHFQITAGLELMSVAFRAAAVIVVIKLHYGVVALAAAVALSAIPSFALTIYFMRTRLPFLSFQLGLVTRQTTRMLFSYGVYTFISQIADTLRFGIDSLVVSAFVGLAAVTHYNIGGVLTQYFIGTMLALLGVFQSVFSQREGAQDIAGMKRAFFFAIKMAMWSAAFIAFGLIAWGKTFIVRWMGASYSDAYPILVVLTVGCFFALAQMPAVSLLFSTNNHRFYAVANVCEALANVILSLLLVRRYGMLGVALGTCIPMLLVKVFVQPIYVSRLCDISLRQYVLQTIRTLSWISVALAVPLLLALTALRPTYPSLVAVALLSAGIYIVPLFLRDLSTNESRVVLKALMPSVGRLAPTDR